MKHLFIVFAMCFTPLLALRLAGVVSLPSIALSARLAVDAVNNDTTILPNVTLSIDIGSDAGCVALNAVSALQGFFRHGTTPETAVRAVIGTACSVTAEPTLLLSAVRFSSFFLLFSQIERKCPAAFNRRVRFCSQIPTFSIL
jgi:hypothetical protein